MNRSEILEIRKIFTYKKGEMSFGNSARCFINTDKKIKGKHNDSFLKDSETEIHKYLDIFKKVISNNGGEAVFNEKDKKDGGMQFLLEKIRGTQLKNDAVNSILFEKIRDALPDNNYAVSLVYGEYDVPVKTKDKLKIDDASSEVFKYIICAISPVKTTKGTLGYLPEKDLIGENAQQLILDTPAFGFVYPSFNDRSSDTDRAFCYTTETLDIADKLFSCKEIVSFKDEKPKNKSVSKGESSPEARRNIPSLNTGSTNYTQEPIEEEYFAPEPEEKATSSTSVEEYAGVPKSTPKSAVSRTVRISGDLKKVSKKNIDGVMCYVIPVNEADLN